MNGDLIYSGHWKEGKRHGQGAGTFKDGIYSGHWKGGQPEGEGNNTALIITRLRLHFTIIDRNFRHSNYGQVHVQRTLVEGPKRWLRKSRAQERLQVRWRVEG
jgi:hypothetical protein